MQGTGKTYEISGETTEWEDILIKKGIKTREEVYLEKGLNPNDVRLNTSEIESYPSNIRIKRNAFFLTPWIFVLNEVY